ncbi:MAG: histidinol-phosphatase, partial [Anaerolineae bacterium]|nr:histidinol-phosphatase [Anaerolineae bacterium]
GLCIPAHVDRPANSLLVNLGFVPPGLDVPGLEVSPRVAVNEFRKANPELARFGLVCSGDAHRLSELVKRTLVVSRAATVRELRQALRGEGDLSVSVI